jgi:ABC-type polysaccharide/polyol phosphate export permease
VLIGLIPWATFEKGVIWGGRALKSHKKSLFNTNISPILFCASGLAIGFVDSIIYAIVLLIIFMFHGFEFNFLGVLSYFYAWLATVLLTMSIAMPVSYLELLYTDTRYVVKYVVQAIFFITPVLYSSQSLPVNIQSILFYNPMFYIVSYARKDYNIIEFNALTFIIMILLIFCLIINNFISKRICKL